jgi:hypothetical protein
MQHQIYKHIGCIVLVLLLIISKALAITGKQESSYLSMPITIHFSEINGLIEKQMDCTLYNDNSYTDNNNDNTLIKVEKNGDIKIVGLKNGIQIELPIRIYYIHRLGFWDLKTDFDMTVVLNSSISLGNTLNILTKTKIQSYNITRDPILDLGGAGINIRYIVELCLNNSLQSIVKELDNSFANNNLIHQKASDLWQYIQQPAVIDTAIKSWIKIKPNNLYIAPIKIYYDQIQINAALESEVYTGIGAPPVMPLIPFKLVVIRNQLDDYFTIHANVDLPYLDLASYCSKLFADTTFHLTANKAFKVKRILIDGNGNSVSITVQTEGSLNSFVTFTGKPVYDASAEEFYLDSFTYSLKSSQLVLQLADRIFYEKFKKSFEKSLHYSMKEKLKEIHDAMAYYLADYKPNDKIKCSGNIDTLQLSNIGSDEQKIWMVFHLKGKAKISLLE